jgi:muramoyltetrapeptide carboxypeptidase LdcA involved in peptidoglycan recycling
MADLFADFPGPVVMGLPSGHTNGAALTLPFGVNCRVTGGTQPRVIVEESAVA